MYTPADKCQVEAQIIKDGRDKLPVAHQEIMDWMSAQFGVKAWNFFFETRKSSNGGEQQLVHVILESPDDVKKIQSDRAGNAVVADRFRNAGVVPPGANIIVSYRPLEWPSGKVDEMLLDDKRAILKKFESVWTISQAVIFYYTSDQVKENAANGTSKRISEELHSAAARYGYDPGGQYWFDSKEIFDREYKSDWVSYWK